MWDPEDTRKYLDGASPSPVIRVSGPRPRAYGSCAGVSGVATPGADAMLRARVTARSLVSQRSFPNLLHFSGIL